MRQSAGIGYISVPTDVDRDEFVSQCLETHTVSITTEDMEFINNVGIDEDKVQSIHFPDTSQEQGSCVVWINIVKANIPCIVAVLNPRDKSSKIKEENTLSVVRRNSVNESINASYKVIGDKAKIQVTTEGESKGESIISLKVFHNQKQGELNAYVQGEIGIQGEKGLDIKVIDGFEITVRDEETDDQYTTIKYTKDDGFSYSDQYDNTVDIKKGKMTFKVGKDVQTEPAVLGDKNKEVLDKISSLVQKILQILITWTSTDSTVASNIGLEGVVSSLAQFEEVNIEFQEVSEMIEVTKSSKIDVS